MTSPRTVWKRSTARKIVLNHSPSRRPEPAGVDEALAHRVDPEIEPFQRPRSQQRQVARLPDDDVVGGPFARGVHERGAGPSLQDRPVGLSKPQRL